jgi:anti-sigma-K factor RskA
MNEREHEARRDELAAYLLGALDAAAAAAVEQHLAGCEECRTELEWLRPAVRMLPESVERVEPPPELRARVMDEARADAGSQRTRTSPSRGAGRWRPVTLRMGVGLAVALALVAGLAGYAIRDGGSGGGATTVAAGQAPGVTAQVISEGDGGTLRLANVSQLPPDEVLQAWVRRGEKVESAKTLFVPNPDGTATAAIDDMRGVEVVMVTAEPRGGSDHPTSEPLVAVAMPN